MDTGMASSTSSTPGSSSSMVSTVSEMLATALSTSFTPTPTSSIIPPTSTSSPSHPRRHLNSVVSFIIGFAIILGASLLNASGLNLTKLDHVRTRAIPKAARRPDWLRPLWLMGMLLYVMSQLIGSTLALEYMRAEYVAPLGSTSLIFNFLFASFLLGTPVTRTDIYGTLVIVLGVIGIVAFGSFNSGLTTEMSLERLKMLWARPGWIVFFVFMTISIAVTYLVVGHLDAILVVRSELTEDPPLTPPGPLAGAWARGRYHWTKLNRTMRDKLTERTNHKGDNQLAWVLGVGWSCCGGLLAGACLVFAKACVKLISGSLSHENEGNQFLHPASIFTIIFLAITAVSQIVCLNRGLKVYDSTLVVPVFYGIYTASGFLNSLIFNDEVDAYQSWTLFLVGVFITILIGGVVMLTNKKPPPPPPGSRMPTIPLRAREEGRVTKGDVMDEESENAALNIHSREEPVMWEVGELSDEEDGTDTLAKAKPKGIGEGRQESSRLMVEEEEEDHVPAQEHRR